MRSWFIIILGFLGLFISAVLIFMLAFRNKNSIIQKSPISHPVSSLTMNIQSPAFQNNDYIPRKFTCDGENISPQLLISGVPENTKILALIMDDPDAPMGIFTHWTLWNIDPKTSVISENSVPSGSIQGKTSFGRIGYGGPCPPAGKPHRYFFKLFALDTLLDLPNDTDKNNLENQINKHLLGRAELIGLYQR